MGNSTDCGALSSGDVAEDHEGADFSAGASAFPEIQIWGIWVECVKRD